jgi:hypothetical protein
MGKVIRLTESDLTRIIRRILKEDVGNNINPKNLKFGDRGPDVTTLQKKLIDMGLLKTKSGRPTGYFGPLTKSALSKALGGTEPIPKTNVNKQDKKTSTYKISPRIDGELTYIKLRKLDDKPFFIYDPKTNLIYLFDKAKDISLSPILIDYTSVVDGADAQKDASPLTQEMWCEMSGLKTTPHICTDPKTNEPKQPYYSVLANTKDRFLSKGIYSIKFLGTSTGYVGGKNNVFKMVDNQGKLLGAAIHGIPNLPERLRASENLESLLKKDIKSGKVPEKYLESIKAIANANQSFGCVGVPAKFIDNPNVQKLAKGARVFVMGEDENFLVNNSNEYFKYLGGDGYKCQNPMNLAQNLGSDIKMA